MIITTIVNITIIIIIIERKKNVEEENKRKLSQFSMYSGNRINHAQDIVSNFIDEQREAYKLLESNIHQFITNKAKVFITYTYSNNNNLSIITNIEYELGIGSNAS